MDWMRDLEVGIPALLEDGVKLLVYAGEYDLICNWLGKAPLSLYLSDVVCCEIGDIGLANYTATAQDMAQWVLVNLRTTALQQGCSGCESG